MFSDPDLSLALRRYAVPIMRTYPSVNLWLAGCGDGADLYGLAILLHEAGLLARSRLYGTDVDGAAIGRAQRADFPFDRARWERAYRAAGGQASIGEYAAIIGGRLVLRPLLCRRLSFFQHDPAVDASFNEFQLIVCGPTLFRDGRLDHERADRLIDSSLCRLGLVAAGSGEGFLGGRAAYRVVDAEAALYRRRW